MTKSFCSFFIMVIVTLMLVSSCKDTPLNDAVIQKNSDNYIESETDDEDINYVQTTPKQSQAVFKERLGIPNSIKKSATSTDGLRQYYIDAQVLVPDVTSIPIYRTKGDYMKDAGGYNALYLLANMGEYNFAQINVINSPKERRVEYRFTKGYDGEIIDENQTELSISESEAQQIAQLFLEQIGLDIVEIQSISIKNKKDTVLAAPEQYEVYQVNCERVINDVPITEISNKWYNLDNEIDYIAELPVEKIFIQINDSGIIGFLWVSPYDSCEIISDTPKLMEFSTIMQRFEDMIFLIHSNYGTDYKGMLEKEIMNIDKIVLSFSAIPEKDNQDSILLVPIWNFFGSETIQLKNGVKKSNSDNKIWLSINAIDGSIV